MIHPKSVSFFASSLVLTALAVVAPSRDIVDRQAIRIDAHSPDYDLARTGIAWKEGLDSVLNRGKPVVLFQLLGEFTKVHC